MGNLSSTELARLDRFLLAHQDHFALALVRISQIPLRAEFAQHVEAFSREHGRSVTQLRMARLNPVEVIHRIREGVPTGCVTLIDGLDAALLEADGETSSLLNRQRERIADYLPGPVLLLASDSAMDRFLVDAPDLADWHAAGFQFGSEVGQGGQSAGESRVPERSQEWIESRIALLENQLCGPMRDRARARVLVELANLYRDSVYAISSNTGQGRPNVPERLDLTEKALREALAILRRLAQEDSDSGSKRDLVRGLTELAQGQFRAGRLAEAESLFLEALKTAEQHLGDEDSATLASRNNLAVLFGRQGRYAEAEPLLERIMTARGGTFGSDDLSTLGAAANLGQVYWNQGRLAEAGMLFQRTIAGRERVLGKDHPDTLAAMNNLALFYLKQGRLAEAESLLNRVLNSREGLLGGDHPSTVATMNNLAVLYRTQGRLSEAETLHKRAFSINERMLGREHPDTLGTMSNLAGLYATQGRLAEAAELAQEALTVQERVMGPEHPDTLTTLNILAQIRAYQGLHQEAESLFEHAVITAQKVLGPDHPDTKLYRENLERLRSTKPA